ncbi:AI-2E family transporter [Halorarius litoreus]|uniref:AI-2E family transporter n=1 Tax=Halorarius litoreus TaxID=2962676 RepID=UPI0020CC96FB|nr:AI-2E family transporter [Halorarius litoreus]
MTVPDRGGTFWWLYVSVLAGAALFIAHTFVGMLVLGVSGYYATRPISNRFETVTESKWMAAGLTALTVLVPVLVLALYAGIRILLQVQQQFDDSVSSMLVSWVLGPDVEETSPAALLRNPASLDRLTDLLSGDTLQQGLQVLDVISGTILLLSLAVTLSYALLVYDEALSSAFAKLVGGQEETVFAYALAVDTDLESIFFGNLLFVLFMSVVATTAYTITNLVAPAEMQIPMAFTLGVLTGLTSLIPIVVSKVVYIPIVVYLAVQAGSRQFVFLGALLVVYFLVLDILPQSVVQPYISGRKVNSMLLLFAYILGPILFGWYGLFLLPIVFVLMLEAVRIVLPELLHGDPIVAEPYLAEGTGADAEEMQQDDADTATSDTDGPGTTRG